MENEKTERVGKEIVTVVEERVAEYTKNGQLNSPPNYSAGNALTAAWLMIQNVESKEHKPALDVCTKDSVMFALLDMVVQGLNPVKKQGYFIVFGNRLVFMRSYFGTMHLCKEMTGATDIYAQCVYQGDEFEYKLQKCKKIIT